MVAGLYLRYTAGTLHTVTSDAHCSRILKLFKNQLISKTILLLVKNALPNVSPMSAQCLPNVLSMSAQFRPMPNLCLSNFCPMSNQYPSYVHLYQPNAQGVRFASFLSGVFVTAIVVNLAKCT